MASRFMSIVSDSLVQLERIYISSLLRISPQLEPVPAMIESVDNNTNSARAQKSFDIKELFGGFLWGVPTCRRSVEKRMTRKYGAPNWHNKLILPKKDLKVCFSCGHYHENNRLCPNCYSIVKEETKAMQGKVVEELGLNPIEQEVVVVYEGETEQQSDEFFKGKRIVEMKKPRPKWFSQNLLQKSGPLVGISDESTPAVKPSDLG